MICDECLHKNVCKEVENFKEYNKQYEEMKKKSSLFDKPIRCPCYLTKDIYREFIKFDNSLDKLKNIEREAKVEVLKSKIENLSDFILYIVREYDRKIRWFSPHITNSKVEKVIIEEFDSIIKDVSCLKIN